jgi:chorismate mutase
MADDIQARIDALRAQIDELDTKMVGLLEDRAKIVMQIRDLKTSHHVAIYDPRREEEIYRHLIAASDGTLYADALRDIYDCVLKHMKEL